MNMRARRRNTSVVSNSIIASSTDTSTQYVCGDSPNSIIASTPGSKYVCGDAHDGDGVVCPLVPDAMACTWPIFNSKHSPRDPPSVVEFEPVKPRETMKESKRAANAYIVKLDRLIKDYESKIVALNKEDDDKKVLSSSRKNRARDKKQNKLSRKEHKKQNKLNRKEHNKKVASSTLKNHARDSKQQNYESLPGELYDM